MDKQVNMDDISFVRRNIFNFSRIKGSNPDFYNEIPLGGQTSAIIDWKKIVHDIADEYKFESKLPCNFEEKALIYCDEIIAAEFKKIFSTFVYSFFEATSNVYPAFLGSSFTYWTNKDFSLNPAINYIDGKIEPVNSTLENYYIENIHSLPNVKALLVEDVQGIKHFLTLLNKRNVVTRDEIYRVELRMYELYDGEDFEFAISHFETPEEVDMHLKGKKILFYER